MGKTAGLVERALSTCSGKGKGGQSGKRGRALSSQKMSIGAKKKSAQTPT